MPVIQYVKTTSGHEAGEFRMVSPRAAKVLVLIKVARYLNEAVALRKPHAVETKAKEPEEAPQPVWTKSPESDPDFKKRGRPKGLKVK